MPGQSKIRSVNADWPPVRGYVLSDDKFDNGPQGWGQLIDATSPRGPISLDTYGAIGKYALTVQTENQAETSSAGWSTAMALKRLTRWKGDGRYMMEVWWGWASQSDKTRPRAFEFGIDTEGADNTSRRFYKFRWLNYDEANSARVTKWQMQTSSEDTPAFTDVPGGVMDLPYNENKRNLVYTAMVFDLGSGVYDGLQVNEYLKLGSLANSPDTSLRAYSVQTSTLADYVHGMNLCCVIRNRTNAAKTKALLHIARVRCQYLGPSPS